MADPYEYVTNSGVIVPDTSTILAGVQDDYRAALGADLSVDPETPQGVLITAEAVSRAEVVNNNAAVANQINPNIAGGVFLDAICALTGFDPPTATFSTIAMSGTLLTGAPGAIIPAGSQAKKSDGTLFQTVSDLTLDGTGNGQVGFQAVVAGPTTCLSGELTTIVTPVIGWETVANTEDATPGQDELSDAQLRTLRNQTLALQGVSLPEAITSGLADTDGVKSFAFRENPTDSPVTIDGIDLVANSVWACVDGGTDAAVATTLLTYKSGGCAWNGDTNVDVVEPSSGQTYTVLFDRPDSIPVIVKVTAKAPLGAVSPEAAIKQAVIDYADGLISNQPGFVTGADVSPFEISGAVMIEVPGVLVSKCEVGLGPSGPLDTVSIPIALNEKATTALASITVVLT